MTGLAGTHKSMCLVKWMDVIIQDIRNTVISASSINEAQENSVQMIKVLKAQTKQELKHLFWAQMQELLLWLIFDQALNIKNTLEFVILHAKIWYK